MKTSPLFHILLLSWLTLGMSGCISDVNLEDQLHETRKLVLFCRIAPQMDTLGVSLSHTQLLYGSGSRDDIQPIADGFVEFSADGEHWVTAPYDPVWQRYRLATADFPILEGHTYYVRAMAEGFEPVSASCTVPYAREVGLHSEQELSQGDVHYGELYAYDHYDTYLCWQDPAGEENYYAFGEVSTWEDEEEEEEEWRTTHLYFSLAYLGDDGREGKVFSDEGRDGTRMRLLYDYDTDPEDWGAEDLSLMFFLDRNNYLYETTYSDASGIDLILLEPTQTYSNIQGGFGLFAAYSVVDLSATLTKTGR
ncbi:MAG: DUF4249 domain-containing protein [Bacteroidales bacterium]|nr:DUF4249 domain-containing protein [Bacteroidales bacterium]